MNSLLLALVMSAATIAPMNQTPQLSVDPVVSQGPCSYNQLHMKVYYYEYPGGPNCGLAYLYCNKPRYHEGCTTEYVNEYTYCWCP